jgi:RHS repeat-associated protein
MTASWRNAARGSLFPVFLGLLAPCPAFSQDVEEYVELDGLGNVRVVTDDKGNVLERHDYLPFGEEICGTLPDLVLCTSVPPGQPRRFTGKELDAETGLHYFGARYYSAPIGRFTTVDPVYRWNDNLLDPQRWNRYAYARNNPLRYVDPDGRAFIEIPQAPLQQNAAIRAAVARSLGGGHPHAQFGSKVVDVLLSTVLPQDINEFRANAEAAVFGMATPLVMAEEAAVALARTPTARLIQHTTRDDLIGAAREAATGVQQGGQHLKEVREAVIGLRERIKDLNQGLSNPRLSADRRQALTRELSTASRNLDAAEEALRGAYRRHDK